MRLKLGNYLYHLNRINRNIQADKEVYIKQPSRYNTDICAPYIKGVRGYRRALRRIEESVLHSYGLEYCQKRNLRLVKRKELTESQLADKVRAEMRVCLGDMFFF